MRKIAALFCLAFLLFSGGPAGHRALAAGENTVSQWNAIAVDAIVTSGTAQAEAFVYLAYVSAAVYDAVVAIEGGYQPYGAAIDAAPDASVDAAVIEAAYRTLIYYLPAKAAVLDPLYATALNGVPNGQAKTDGLAVGAAAAAQIIAMRNGDGRKLPIGTTAEITPKLPGPGVWRKTPTAYAAPQIPWVGSMKPFVLDAGDHFQPDPPPSLQSQEWVDAFNEVKAYGAASGSVRTSEETAIALFWTANVNRQFNWAARDIIEREDLDLLDSARLQAMVNVVAADICISWVNAKYRELFWRPVTAIDPTSVTNDGYGPIPGFDDGNPKTVEQAGWRPLVVTPNHPEFPSAHATVTSAMAEIFSTFVDTNRFELKIRGFDPDGAAGNFNAVQVFGMPHDMRQQVIDARTWGGVHYRFSSVAGVAFGRQISKYVLRHAFRPER